MTTSRHKPAPARQEAYGHQFVDQLPDVLEEGVLYVSTRYATAAHNCFCGCGREVVTPLHPTKWTLTFDGLSASIDPSVGSWSLDCKSHYWLKGGRVRWAKTFSDERIRAVRARDARDDDTFYSPPVQADDVGKVAAPPPATRCQRIVNWWWGK